MSDISIGSSPAPISGPDATTPVSQTQPQVQPQKKDTLSQASTPAKQADVVADVPVLASPKKNISFFDTLSLINKAKNESRDLHQQSIEIDFNNAEKRRALIDEIIITIEEDQTALNQLPATTETQTDGIINFVKATNSQIEQLVSKQNALISSLNGGNAEEKKQGENLSKAYDTYTKGLKELGAVDMGDGVYSIPELKTDEDKAKYEKLTADYTKAVGDFNSYWDKRSGEINDFNAKMEGFNNEANQINQSIGAFNEANNNLGTKGLNAQTAKLHEAPTDKIPVPSSTGSPPASITIGPKPTFASPTTISSISYKSVSAEKSHDSIYNSIYDQQKSELETKIAANFTLLKQLKSADNERPDDAIEKMTSLTDVLFSEISADMQNDPTQIQKEKLVGKKMMEAVIQETQASAAQIEKLEQKLEVISQEMLKVASRDALVESIRLAGSNLAATPKGDPAFLAQYATSFANAAVDRAIYGSTERAINQFPDLAGHTQELTAAVNIIQLVLAGKLLETNASNQPIGEVMNRVKGEIENQLKILEGRPSAHAEALNFINNTTPGESAPILSALNAPANSIVNAVSTEKADWTLSANKMIQG